MKIVVRKTKLASELALYSGILASVAGAIYCFTFSKAHEMGVGLAILGVVLAVLFIGLPYGNETLIIDQNGVVDRRLGVGRIHWADVEDVQIQALYGNRFLCLRLRDPEQYLSRLSGRRREKAVYHQKLGFGRLNVEIGDLEVSLLDLKRLIERRVARHRA